MNQIELELWTLLRAETRPQVMDPERGGPAHRVALNEPAKQYLVEKHFLILTELRRHRETREKRPIEREPAIEIPTPVKAQPRSHR